MSCLICGDSTDIDSATPRWHSMCLAQLMCICGEPLDSEDVVHVPEHGFINSRHIFNKVCKLCNTELGCRPNIEHCRHAFHMDCLREIEFCICGAEIRDSEVKILDNGLICGKTHCSDICVKCKQPINCLPRCRVPATRVFVHTHCFDLVCNQCSFCIVMPWSSRLNRLGLFRSLQDSTVRPTLLYFALITVRYKIVIPKDIKTLIMNMVIKDAKGLFYCSQTFCLEKSPRCRQCDGELCDRSLHDPLSVGRCAINQCTNLLFIQCEVAAMLNCSVDDIQSNDSSWAFLRARQLVSKLPSEIDHGKLALYLSLSLR